MNRKEILNQIKEIELSIKELKTQVDDSYNKEQAIKLVLNSIYGR